MARSATAKERGSKIGPSLAPATQASGRAPQASPGQAELPGWRARGRCLARGPGSQPSAAAARAPRGKLALSRPGAAELAGSALGAAAPASGAAGARWGKAGSRAALPAPALGARSPRSRARRLFLAALGARQQASLPQGPQGARPGRWRAGGGGGARGQGGGRERGRPCGAAKPRSSQGGSAGAESCASGSCQRPAEPARAPGALREESSAGHFCRFFAKRQAQGFCPRRQSQAAAKASSRLGAPGAAGSAPPEPAPRPRARQGRPSPRQS